MASTTKIMNKPHQEQQQPQAVLKCPRCDSSNTKFCYYNNYSLSQPRHFCKACKRYWTRGGTLRNVPVGGGCRKNKRLKTSSSIVNVASSLAPSSNPRPQNGINLSSSVSSHITPMFYDSNLQFSRLESVSGLNLPPQLDATAAAVGLGFSSGVMSHIADLRDGFDSVKQIQEMVTSNNHFHPTISFQRNMQVLGNSEDNLIATKEVKMDQSINRSSCQNQTEQMDLSFSDPNSHYWNTTTTTTIATGNNWLDQMNTGSSVTSLF